MKKIAKKAHNELYVLILSIFIISSSALFGNNFQPNFENFCSPSYHTDDTIPSTPAPKKKRGSRKIVSYATFEENFHRAVNFYNKGSWLTAAKIFEELYPLSFGTKYGDSILFMFADCYMQNHDYQLAAFHFKDYAKRYPGTERTQTALFNCVKSIYAVCPDYNVDQSETLLAIDEINNFINQYPQSKHVEECNQMLDILRETLAKKDYEVFRLYYNTEHYEAAQIACKNFLKSHSYSKHAEDAMFLLVKNNYEYASKSIETKQLERYRACTDAFDAFFAQYPESAYLKEAEQMARMAAKQIEKLKSKQE